MKYLTSDSRTYPMLAYLAAAALVLGLMLTPKPANAGYNECTTDEEAAAECANDMIGSKIIGGHCQNNVAFCHVEGEPTSET